MPLPPVLRIVPGRRKVVRGFDGDGLDAGHAALGESGQGAGGASSMTPVTPRCTSVSMQRSQRTGRETCAIRLSTAAPPSVTSSAVEVGQQRYLRVLRLQARACSASRALTAGAMCEVWNAPATFSGMTRALAGGFSARALSCSKVPAATVWPAPLTLAAVAPGSLNGCQDLCGVPAHHGAHAGRGDGGGGGHAVGAFTDERHGFVFGQHAGEGRAR